MKQGLIDPASINSTDQDVDRVMGLGTRTFCIQTDYHLKVMNDPEKSKEAGNIKMALVPGTKSQRSGTIAYVRFYGLTRDCDQKENAVQLLCFLGGKDKNGEYFVPKKWALNFGLGFMQQGLFKNKEVADSIAKWGDPTVLREQDVYTADRSYRLTPWFADWETESWGELQKAVLGQADPHQILVKLADEAKELKKKYQ